MRMLSPSLIMLYYLLALSRVGTRAYDIKVLLKERLLQ